jgi:hypothetical protein
MGHKGHKGGASERSESAQALTANDVKIRSGLHVLVSFLTSKVLMLPSAGNKFDVFFMCFRSRPAFSARAQTECSTAFGVVGGLRGKGALTAAE